VPRRRNRDDAERRLRARRRLRPRRPERPGPKERRALYPILEKLERAPGDLAPSELVRAGWLSARRPGSLGLCWSSWSRWSPRRARVRAAFQPGLRPVRTSCSTTGDEEPTKGAPNDVTAQPGGQPPACRAVDDREPGGTPPGTVRAAAEDRAGCVQGRVARDHGRREAGSPRGGGGLGRCPLHPAAGRHAPACPAPRSRRRRSCAFRATTMVEALIKIAPTAGANSMPSGASTPAATGTVTKL
jgi:hypothetical protein